MCKSTPVLPKATSTFYDRKNHRPVPEPAEKAQVRLTLFPAGRSNLDLPSCEAGAAAFEQWLFIGVYASRIYFLAGPPAASNNIMIFDEKSSNPKRLAGTVQVQAQDEQLGVERCWGRLTPGTSFCVDVLLLEKIDLIRLMKGSSNWPNWHCWSVIYVVLLLKVKDLGQC